MVVLCVLLLYVVQWCGRARGSIVRVVRWCCMQCANPWRPILDGSENS